MNMKMIRHRIFKKNAVKPDVKKNKSIKVLLRTFNLVLRQHVLFSA